MGLGLRLDWLEASIMDEILFIFHHSAVSVVWRQKISLRNGHTDGEGAALSISSISGSSLHFHCSFVADKVLPPAANTSLEIVFLSREEGFVEDTLFVHTSAGSFPYRVGLFFDIMRLPFMEF